MKADAINAMRALPANPKARVRVALAMKGLNQRDLADAVGIDYGLLSNALVGRRALSDEQVEAIGEFLGVPVDVLFPKVAA